LKKKKFDIDSKFRLKALIWADLFSHVAYLNHNMIDYKYDPFPEILAAGAMEVCSDTLSQLDKLADMSAQTLFGYFSYELKNDIESLTSSNEDRLEFSKLCFFSPRHIFYFNGNSVEIETQDDPESIFLAIENTIDFINPGTKKIEVKANTSKEEYIRNVNSIKEHIKKGDIYEMNYCINFYAENIHINPLLIYQKLNSISPMPFSAYLKTEGHYLICASPERFLKKEKNKLISQPIKGTARRNNSEALDVTIRQALQQNEKERAENIMIVDLVRNDLARTSVAGSVNVEELCGIYSFKNLHQMVSTITAELNTDTSLSDIINTTFPMGSMTGAPKIRAMELIEKYENFQRGLFSGSVGYISPEGDFDFNVVIRSILYNAEKQYLSFSVGSAITYYCDAEREYEECILKAESMMKALK
jgi:para-aminobenzoate synthetase component 1